MAVSMKKELVVMVAVAALVLAGIVGYLVMGEETPAVEQTAAVSAPAPAASTPAAVVPEAAPPAAQTTEAPVAPATEAPAVAPATEAPAVAPATEAPAVAPATEATAVAPATEAPAVAPATEATAVAPATEAPATATPSGPAPLEARLAEMWMGSPDAPVTMIEYASLTCPHCARFHTEVLPQIRADYIDTGKVRMIFREVYFDLPGLRGTMLARCEPARYFGIISELFRTQKTWPRATTEPELAANLRAIGKLAFVAEDRIDACLADKDFENALVKTYQEQSAKDGIESTPSFIINGEKVSNRDYAGFKAILDAKLK